MCLSEYLFCLIHDNISDAFYTMTDLWLTNTIIKDCSKNIVWCSKNIFISTNAHIEYVFQWKRLVTITFIWSHTYIRLCIFNVVHHVLYSPLLVSLLRRMDQDSKFLRLM